MLKLETVESLKYVFFILVIVFKLWQGFIFYPIRKDPEIKIFEHTEGGEVRMDNNDGLLTVNLKNKTGGSSMKREEFLKLVDKKDFKAIKSVLNVMNVVDLADLLSELSLIHI